MLFRTHPGYDQLSRLADGELAPAEAMEVNGHLAQCDRCREEVDFMAELRERLRALAVPGPPSGLLPEILDRRESGDRVVLPLAAALEDTGRWRFRKGAAALVAVLVLAVAAFFVLRPQSIRAGSTTFEVEMREAGRPVEVSFVTAGGLAGESILRVRAEYFTFGELELGSTESGTLVEGVLRSRGDGEFRGEVLLPSTVAYARFVVEDYRGEDIERDYAEGWEYLARNENGEPTFEALWQRTLALESVAPREALESARELAERYPDRPEGWIYRLANEGEGGIVRDAPPVGAFLNRLPPDPRADELATIADYAGRTGADDVVSDLLQRIEAIDPRHPAVVQNRVERILADLQANPAQLLASLESEWLSHGHPDAVLLPMGLATALEAGATDAARRWADRWVAADPAANAEVAAMLGQLPELRPVAIDRLRAELGRIERPMTRPLGKTRSDDRRAVDRRRAGVFASLGHLLLAEGELDEASDALSRAAAHAWDSDTLERLVRVSEVLGRDDIADRYRLLLVADPLLETEDRHRIVTELGLTSTELESRVDQVRREMIGGMLGSTRDRIFPSGSIRLAAVDGGPRDLGARLGHAPTLVQFWTPLLSSSVRKLEFLLGECDRLTDEGVRLIAVSADAVGENQLPDGHETCQGFEILIDSGSEARLAFRTDVLSEGILLDRGGQIRARFVDALDEVRAALVLAAIQ